VVGLLAYNFSVTLPLFVTRSLGGTDGQFTLIYAIFSAGAVVSALVVAQRHLVKIHHVVVGSVCLAGAMGLLAIVPSVAAAVPVAFLVGVSSILYMTSTTAIVQVEADPAMHGRILALQTVLLIGSAPLGGPLLGWLADALGARAPIAVGAVSCLVAGAYGAVASRRAGPRRPAHGGWLTPVDQVG
jgi:MFS family permease